ncbi:hypothetical protein SAMN05216299_106146 [Nitrosospira sp. Nsp14]|uniref:hypothetical protein n=1 Tax=Nitrosospira sp. Nsp14 TaxID=1855333 RepID=UPI0008E9B395|nr:hypothetical protein [Nitrosospira sp. Nsp14]SFH32145.1 hypothetical protein SAMN05216299_106146 [Nitrosospira sp. Nsp14]
MLYDKRFFTFVLWSLSFAIHAGPFEEMGAVQKIKTGSASEERYWPVGPLDPLDALPMMLGFMGGGIGGGGTPQWKGCQGNDFDATVEITSISAKLENNVALLSVTYRGNYTRQGSSGIDRLDAGGKIVCDTITIFDTAERRKLSGVYTLRITSNEPNKPIITWGEGSEFKEVSDPNHDANIFAIRAVQNAVESGLKVSK